MIMSRLPFSLRHPLGLTSLDDDDDDDDDDDVDDDCCYYY